MNVDANSVFTEIFAKVASHCLDANMEVVTFLSNAYVIQDGMVFFAVNVSA